MPDLRSRCDAGPRFIQSIPAFGQRLAAIDDTGDSLSYSTLATRADAVAESLGPIRRLVLIEPRNSVESLVAYVGALAGNHVVLLGSEGGGARLAEAWQPDAVFSGQDDSWSIAAVHPRRNLHADLAVLLSTSGTTGATKLVRLATTALDANATSICAFLDIEADDRALVTLPFHYSYGLSLVHSHLAAGAALLLTKGSLLDPETLAFAEEFGVTSLAGVPHSYELLDRIDFMRRAPASLRCLTQAGGRMSPDAVARYAAWAAETGRRFYVMYGQTEATARMAYLPPAALADHPDCIGVAIPGGAFTLVDDAGLVVDAPETPGELVYRGDNIMMGYAEVPADLALPAGLDRLATGDIAVRNSAGYYRIVGRSSRFVKPMGLRIALDEVEAALQRHGWRGAATGNDSFIAVEVLDGAAPATVTAALAAEFKLAATLFHVTAVHEQSRLPSGKIDYRSILLAAQAERDTTPSDAVAAAFARAFPSRTLRPTDSFVMLGGDSLGYVAMSIALEDAMGTAPDGWEAMTLAELELFERNAKPRQGWSNRIGTDIVLRALAIVAVIVNHSSSFVVGGGASVLLLLVGYNLARFQRARLIEGHGMAVVKGFATRIIAPYYAILVIYMAYKGHVTWPALLLCGNLFGEFESFIEPYWFIEAMLQIYLVVAGVFVFARVRRAAMLQPWRFGLLLLAAAVAIREVGALVFDERGLADRTPDALLYLVVLGWCIHHADTPSRRFTLGAVLLLLVGFSASVLPGGWSVPETPSGIAHALWLSVAVCLLLWLPRLPMPPLGRRVFGAVAGASFYIYLVHGVPAHYLHTETDVARVMIAIVGSVAVGIAVHHISQFVEAFPVAKWLPFLTPWSSVRLRSEP
ncbi:AMP-binding protein [Sphingosinicellaceae bacterium]|nr:AMP-binding protein [Sphingosinicellaceae bacterium]